MSKSGPKFSQVFFTEVHPFPRRRAIPSVRDKIDTLQYLNFVPELPRFRRALAVRNSRVRSLHAGFLQDRPTAFRPCPLAPRCALPKDVHRKWDLRPKRPNELPSVGL